MSMVDADRLIIELMDAGLDHIQGDDGREVIQIVMDLQADAITNGAGNGNQTDGPSDARMRHILSGGRPGDLMRNVDAESVSKALHILCDYVKKQLEEEKIQRGSELSAALLMAADALYKELGHLRNNPRSV